jgi:single-strand DNA-binding protein
MFMATIAGNLGADAEVRHTPSGQVVCSFRVGASVGFGERKKTEWVTCSKWGKGAEGVAPHLTKGTKVVVVGEFSTREWTDSQGETKTSLEIRVSELDFTGCRQGAGQARPQSPSQRAQTPPADGFDDDMPF